MTSAIWRPCYATREEVMRAMDMKQAAYTSDQVDRQLIMASESVDGLCKRKFYPEDGIRYFDWPNYQYAYPWRLWLDANELAANQTQNPNTVLASGGNVIPNTAFFCRSENYGPPFTRIELDRSQNFSFGNGPTPQRDISLQATFGFWLKTLPATTLASAVTSSTQAQIQVANGSNPGVGDAILIGSERMLVQSKSWITTGVTTSGLTSASMADNLIAVPDVTVFNIGETLLYDAERLLILDTLGEQLLVKRAWEGSVLTTHTGGTLYVSRLLTVLRGALGTSAASSYSSNAAVSTFVPPGLVKELALAESVVGLTQEPGAYTFGLLSTLSTSANVYGSTAHGQQREPGPGLGLQDLRTKVVDRFGRQSRSRVV